MKYFDKLSQTELEQLEEAIPQIAVLIAGADGTIDVKETEWAEKLTHIRTYSSSKDLQGFYDQVDANFSIRFNALVKKLPKNTAERQAQLSNDLAQINPLLAKLDADVAYHLYESMVSFAKNIARSSGGFLGYGSVSETEKKWVNLPMITPIAAPSNEKEETV